MYGPTIELPATVIEAIAQVVAAELDRVARVIPASPASALGRLADPASDRRLHGVPSARRATDAAMPRHGSAAKIGLTELPALVAERLLGALELTVAGLDLPVPQLVEALPEVSGGGPRMVAITSVSVESEMSSELSKLDAFVPGGTDMVAHVVAALVEHPLVAPLLDVADPGADEGAIAASHGARYLALAVVVAAIAVRPLWPTVTPAAIIGAALGVAGQMLRVAPMPDAYAEAALAKRRAEYLMPRHMNGSAVVTGHVFTLAEGPLTSGVNFFDNGLVAAVPDGIAVLTGEEHGTLRVGLSVVKEPPKLDVSVWDEVVEISWHAPAGGASLSGTSDPNHIAPPWPGDYRVRVHARGRDEGLGQYHLAMWSAPPADPVVHKHSDRLGYAARGETEPPSIVPPDEVYHWVESSWLAEAATFTFVAGKSSLEVLRDFGADESAPTPTREFFERDDYHHIDPWVCVLDVPGGTVAVEYNGWQGSNRPVLRALSSPDNLAASMYWNINAVRRLGLARNGEMVTQFEPGCDDVPSEAQELLADLDVHGRHGNAVGLLAATRFTGISLSAEDFARMQAVDIGYPILPLLDELHTEQRLPDGSRRWPGHGPLGADTDRLARVPDEDLRELAWWVAAFAAEHSELSQHPAVMATLAARALTPEAETLARSNVMYGKQHHWLWTTLHAATNPDPLSAAIQALEAARHAVAGRAAELLEQARARAGIG